jgi:hypothetical protein
MQPADIYSSENLGTNAVHYQANRVLSQMSELLHDGPSVIKYKKIADRIKKGINAYLWLPKSGYYGQYLYGRNYQILSPRSEALGEALTVLFDIADSSKQQQIISHTPITPFGISCIYPQIPGIPPYHNNAVWPFVQTYWLWAAAKAGNEKAAMESISAIYRPAALFLTNKENFVAENGDFSGTQINSSNMLWSLSGNISIIHHVIFGIQFMTNGILFQPFVPIALQGKRSLDNFACREAILNIKMEGYGNKIAAFYIDGKRADKAFFPYSLKGSHTIRIVLANNQLAGNGIHEVENAFTPATPTITRTTDTLYWQPVAGAKYYDILRNGISFQHTELTSIQVKENGYADYQVIAVDEHGFGSFASEPVVVLAPGLEQSYEIEQYAGKSGLAYKGYTGDGFVETTREANTAVVIPVTVTHTGLYTIDIRYANGNGPVNTENKCAVRSLLVNGKLSGTLVMPQRGKGEWSNWGYSNPVKVRLDKGRNQVSISFAAFNENMNGEINQAMLDNLRVIPLN